jgi:hypothetical protein
MHDAQFTPPTKVCTHCGAQAQTTADRCPNCNKRYGRRGRGLRIAGWGCLGMVAGSIAIVAVIALAISAGVEEAEEEQDRVGITLSEFRSIEQGTSQQEVVDTLGEPEDAQEFEQQIPELESTPARSSCIYYPEKGKPLFEGRSFQFCFDDGRLTSKNAY